VRQALAESVREDKIAAFYSAVVDRVTTLPGVAAAGMVNRFPLASQDLALAFEFETNRVPLSPQPDPLCQITFGH